MGNGPHAGVQVDSSPPPGGLGEVFKLVPKFKAGDQK